MREHDGKFILEDGTVLTGWSFGAERSASGEVVFNTGMVRVFQHSVIVD